MTRRLKFTIEYDGHHYNGWQRQPTYPSVQQTIEDTLKRITQHHSPVVGSGRTDSGVHARAQVAHSDVNSKLSDDDLKKALNSLLPDDIVIRDLQTTHYSFHAQKNIECKTYVYQIHQAELHSPLFRHQSWWLPYDLNIAKMNEAAQLIIGEHDFKAFQNQGSSVRTSVRTIYTSAFRKNPPYLIYEVSGGGFLKQMIRNLVNCFIRIGRGRLTIDEFKLLFEGRDRKLCPPPAPAHGLFLQEVRYRPF